MRQKIKRLLSLLLKTGITTGVIFWIISKFGWSTIASTIAGADPIWIVAGVLLFILSVVLGALQWRILLHNRGLNLPLGKTISLYFTGIFFNNFMLGMVAGDSYKIAHLHFNEGRAKSGFAATFFDRIAGLLVISIFALAGGVWLFASGESASSGMNKILVFTLFFALLLIGFFILFVSKRLQAWSLSVAARIPERHGRQRIQSVLKELFIDRHDAEEKRTFLVVLAYAFVIQFIRMVVHIMAALSLGIFQMATVHYFFIIIPIIAFMTIVPLPFGIKEALGGTLFLAAGYAHNDAVVMEFIATIMGIGGSLFGGITFILDRRSESR